MKRKFILLFLVLLLAAICIVPVSQEKTISIKSPFLNTFVQLQTAKNWLKWRSDLRQVDLTDSDKIAVKNLGDSFMISYSDLVLKVKTNQGSFDVQEKDKSTVLNYTLTVLPDKIPVNSFVTMSITSPFIKYLYSFFKDNLLEKTHIIDLKKFLETDSLYYGYDIVKSNVPGTKLIVKRQEVLNKDKFLEAAKMLAALKAYAKLNNLTQVKPLIAQFIPTIKDSVQLNIGLFVDKDAKSTKEITFNRMPKTGVMYSAKYYGPFNKRPKAYAAMHRFFADKQYQSAVIPFESYLDNKLPTTDTDKIKVQIDFTSYF